MFFFNATRQMALRLEAAIEHSINPLNTPSVLIDTKIKTLE
jgi:hypothetical protein